MDELELLAWEVLVVVGSIIYLMSKVRIKLSSDAKLTITIFMLTCVTLYLL